MTNDSTEVSVQPDLTVETVEEAADSFDIFMTGLEANDDSVTISVYRQGGSGKSPMTFLFKTTPDNYSGEELLEKIAKEFGSGDYRIHGRNATSLIFNKVVSVEAPKELEKPASNSEYFSDVIKTMQENTREQMQQLKEMILLNQNNQEPTSMKGMLELLVMSREIFAPQNQAPAQPQQTPAQMLKEMMEVKSIADELTGDKKDDGMTGLLSMGSDFISTLNKFADNDKEQIKMKKSQQTNAPQKPQQENNDMNPLHLMKLKKLMVDIKEAAKRQVNYDHLTGALKKHYGDMIEGVIDYLTSEGAYDEIAQHDPDFSGDVVEYVEGYLLHIGAIEIEDTTGTNGNEPDTGHVESNDETSEAIRESASDS